jgi:excisionase family DNA binding protein
MPSATSIAARRAQRNQPEPFVPLDLMTPAEVAALLRVDPKTVTRWARAGRLSSLRTPGGHRRYLKSEVLAFLNPQREGR